MPAKQPEPSPIRGSDASSAGAARLHQESDERFGPLTVARHVKADGRALILYSRIEPESR